VSEECETHPAGASPPKSCNATKHDKSIFLYCQTMRIFSNELEQQPIELAEHSKSQVNASI